MNQEDIRRNLHFLPTTDSAAFSVRVAMRWLPFLKVAPHGQFKMRDLKSIPLFAYWPELKRQSNLLAVLHAVVGTMGVAVGSTIACKGAAKRCSAAVAAYIAADDNAAHAAYAAGSAAAAAAYAQAISDHCLADDTSTEVAKFSDYILLNFTKKEAEIVWEQYQYDFRLIETQSATALLNAPLWRAGPPATWQKKWDIFVKEVINFEPSFRIWLQLLEARIVGDPIILPLLEQWLALPPEIGIQPPASINQYLASLGHAKQALNRVRTIFIGYGDAGKTSLIRTLHGEPVVAGREAMTPGIQIREWAGADNNIITHFWDFGGQVMAHATHQFFLRASCLYVLVLSARAEINATEQAEYWLQHVQAFGDNANVLIVGNKDDQTPVHVDMASLQAKYPNILGFYPLSCTQTGGRYQYKFDSFKTDFCHQLTLLGMHQVMFTDAQFRVLTELRRRAAKQAFLKHSEFDALCKRHRIGRNGSQTKENFLELLDKLGIVIHFKDLPYLSEHVLNPRWLTYGVYTVMYAQRARLSLPEIVTLLSKAEVCDEAGQTLPYPPEKCLFITTAMQRFKLCYHLPHDSNRFIIPGLLETDQPPILKHAQFDKTQALAYKIVFTGFVPRHVMPELIVENNEAIENEVVWQYGVLLRHRELDARALAQVDYQARELTIWVAGKDARDYLSHLRDDIKRILSRLTMKYEEQIRLPAGTRLDQLLAMGTEDDWAGYQQFELCLKEGDKTFKSVRGFKYDLAQVARLYLKREARTVGGDTYHFYGDQPKFIQPGGNMAGDKIININGGVVNAPVVNADHVENSFTTTNNHYNTNPELAKTLQQLLAEIQSLNAKIPAAQVAPIAEEANALVAETQRPEPRPRWYQASLGGIIEAGQKLGEVGMPLLVLAEKVKSLLPL